MLLKDSPLYWEGSLDLKRGNRQERPQPGWTYGLRSHMSKRDCLPSRTDLHLTKPQFEDGSVYREIRPTRRGSNSL